MADPWMVRRDTINPSFPWAWFCKGRIKEGLVNRACSVGGPASTENDAHARALKHARDVHGYNPTA